MNNAIQEFSLVQAQGRLLLLLSQQQFLQRELHSRAATLYCSLLGPLGRSHPVYTIMKTDIFSSEADMFCEQLIS